MNKWDPVRWSPADLDRCEHGRHCIDHCFDCGPHPLNWFLLHPERIPPHERARTVDGRIEVRIGTMVHGEPIWVVAKDAPRETQ